MATAAAPLLDARKAVRAPNAHISCRTTPTIEFPARGGRSGNGGASIDDGSVPIDGLFPPATVRETANSFRILIPLCGVDLRQIYVVAQARSIIVEIRIKSRIDHVGVDVTEVQEQRVVRELNFSVNIKQRTTAVRIVRGDLEITCMKSKNGDDRAWSDLVQFDTRSSLGCV